MTCIVGIVDEGNVYLAADSAGHDGQTLIRRADKKVFQLGDFGFGFTSSFRFGQILRYAFCPPPRTAIDLMTYMCTGFIDGIRTALKAGGYAEKINEAERGGTLMVATGGRLFIVYSDYQVAESLDGYAACGSGEQFALGSLFSTKGLPASKRIQLALTSAAMYSAGVSEPFNVELISP